MGSNPTVTATENPWLSGGFLHFRGDRGGSPRRAVHRLAQLRPHALMEPLRAASDGAGCAPNVRTTSRGMATADAEPSHDPRKS